VEQSERNQERPQPDGIRDQPAGIGYRPAQLELFETAPLGYLALDSEGRILSANWIATELLGSDLSALLAQRFEELCAEEDHAVFHKHLRDTLSSGSGRCTLSLREELGPVVLRLESRSDGSRCTTALIDITEERRAEEALQEEDRRKDAFLAVLAHELRNPLAPILCSAQTLERAGDDPEVVRRARQCLEKQVRHLGRLVEDLLDVSRVRSGRLTLRPERIRVAAILQRAVELCGPELTARRHHLSLELPPRPVYLEADPVRLTQIVVNLLQNAAKYTPAGGRIQIAARVRGGEVAISIRDNGIGIAAEAMPHLFELFGRGRDPEVTSKNGLGLGLALAKQLVELHHGRIAACSDGRDRGSEFVVHLLLPPQRGRARIEMRPTAEPEPETKLARRVLIVDDQPEVAESLGLLLQVMGHEVRLAFDGKHALEEARSFNPEIAILDIGMPEMDGYELARRIRKHPALNDLVLVACSGWGQAADRERALAAGFDRHFTKPLVHERIAEILRMAGERRA